MTSPRSDRLVEEWDAITRAHGPTSRPHLSAGTNGRISGVLIVAVVTLVVALPLVGLALNAGRAPTPEPSASLEGGAAALAEWWVDPQALPIAPATTTIKAFLRERECASGQSPEGRIAGPQIDYGADAVIVTFRVRAIGGTCPGNPAFPVTITLTEPLGNRSIVDGSTGRDATIDPMIVLEPTEDCGPLVGTEDAKVACMALITATLGDRYAAFAKVAVTVDGASCSADACTTLVGIEARAWLVSATDRNGAFSAWRCSYKAEVATCDPGTPAATSPPPAGTAVDDAGVFAGGGLWALRGSELFISLDRGESWRASTLPQETGPDPWARRVVVLDADHAWIVQNGAGNTGFTGSTTDIDTFTVSRTTDAGTTWTTADVPGNYPDSYPALAFADPEHGYLVAAASRLSLGVSSVLRSDDGGATWALAGTKPWLDRLVAVSDPDTVWAGGEQQAGGQFDQPILSVSRDAGRTWKDLLLPGLPGRTEANCGCYLPGPPVFTSSTDAYVVVVNSFGNGTNGSWLDTTSDGGRTWILRSFRPNVEASGAAELNTDQWLMARVNPSGMDSSSDAGKTWVSVANAGVFAGTSPSWMQALDGSSVAALVLGSGTVLHLLLSTDGGTTWTDVGPP